MKNLGSAAIVACALFTLPALAQAAGAKATTRSSYSFLDTLGVNTHTMYLDAAYPNGGATKIANELAYLGIRHVRDDMPFSWGIPEYQALAAVGVKFDFYIAAGSGVDSLPAQIADIANLAPNVLSIEGPNETDLTPLTYAGLNGLPATAAMQAALYQQVQTYKGVAGAPVIESSFGSSSSFPKAAGMGHANYANTHSYYFNFDVPIATQIANFVTEAREVAPGAPTMTTESGWESVPVPPAYPWIDYTTQAKLTLDMVFDQYDAGISATYIYQLMDQDELGDYYGLFTQSGAPKPAATALRNLTKILADGASTAQSYAGALNYTLTGMPATGRSTIVAKSRERFDLVLRNEVSIYDSAHATDIAAAPVPVSLSLGATYGTVAIYDPLLGPAAQQIYHNASFLRVDVLDHPIVIQVSNP